MFKDNPAKQVQEPFLMSQPIIHPNLKRRRVIQGVVISTAALAAPGLVSAASSTGTSRRAQAKYSLPENRLKPISEEIAMELVENAGSIGAYQRRIRVLDWYSALTSVNFVTLS